LFGVALALLVAFGDRPGGTTFGSTPIGPLVAIALLGVILRRVYCGGDARWFTHWCGCGAPKNSPAFTV